MIAVVGHTGMVGRQVYRWFDERLQLPVAGWALDAQEWDWTGADIVFICVPTLHGPELVEATLARLEDGVTAVIKSTVPPGTTSMLQAEYPDLTVLCNPEFLSERTAWTDFLYPERQIVGYWPKEDEAAREKACRLIDLLPRCPANRVYVVPAFVAEVAKYAGNAHGATQVMLSNFFYDVFLAHEEEEHWDLLGRIIPNDLLPESVVSRYWQVWDGGYRGFGGKCFPKDMATLAEYAAQWCVPAELIEAAIAANKRLHREQGREYEDGR